MCAFASLALIVKYFFLSGIFIISRLFFLNKKYKSDTRHGRIVCPHTTVCWYIYYGKVIFFYLSFILSFIANTDNSNIAFVLNSGGD